MLFIELMHLPLSSFEGVRTHPSLFLLESLLPADQVVEVAALFYFPVEDFIYGSLRAHGKMNYSMRHFIDADYVPIQFNPTHQQVSVCQMSRIGCEWKEAGWQLSIINKGRNG